jgi:host factor-I protein
MVKMIDRSRADLVPGVPDRSRAGGSCSADDGGLWRETKEQPMEKLAQNIQEAFLNNARKDKTFLTIYLMSGVKLSGRIKSFDKYSVILETNNQEQLIFKHAISTVVVSKPFHSTGSHPVSAQTVGGVHPAPGAPVTEQSE